jgi:hypothetical protein
MIFLFIISGFVLVCVFFYYLLCVFVFFFGVFGFFATVIEKKAATVKSATATPLPLSKSDTVTQ